MIVAQAKFHYLFISNIYYIVDILIASDEFELLEVYRQYTFKEFLSSAMINKKNLIKFINRNWRF
jgi:hypothetical protein